MGMLDFLNKVKAENIDLKDLVREENSVSNDLSFEFSLGKDAECKETGKYSFTYKQTDYRGKKLDCAFGLDVKGIDISQSPDSDIVAGKVYEPFGKVVVTPWVATGTERYWYDGLAHLNSRAYGKPVVFEGDFKDMLFMDYLDNARKNPAKTAEKIMEEIMDRPIVVPRKYRSLVKYSPSRDKRTPGTLSREGYLDERGLSWKSLSVSMMKENSNGDWEFHIDRKSLSDTDARADFERWLNDPMREVELRAGKDRMDNLQKGLSCIQLVEMLPMLDFESINNDTDNRRKDLHLTEKDFEKFYDGHSISVSVMNVPRKTGNISDNMNIYLKCRDDEGNNWKLKIPAKTMFVRSLGASYGDSKKFKKMFSFTVPDDCNIKMALCHEKTGKEQFALVAKAKDFLKLSETAGHGVFIDIGENGIGDFTQTYLMPCVDKCLNELEPIDIRVSAKDRKDILYGKKDDKSFIVFRNLGKNFSARLECSHLEVDKDGGIFAQIVPMQSVNIPVKGKDGVDKMEVAVINLEDVEMLFKANSKLAVKSRPKTAERKRNDGRSDGNGMDSK